MVMKKLRALKRCLRIRDVPHDSLLLQVVGEDVRVPLQDE